MRAIGLLRDEVEPVDFFDVFNDEETDICVERETALEQTDLGTSMV